MVDEILPAISSENTDSSNNTNPHPLWIRVSAFLSLKSENTQKTYLGILREWCEFLGSESGTKDAAKKMLEVTDLEAIAYKNWLMKRPGQQPRLQRKKAAEQALSIERRKASNRDGTQSTQSESTIAKKFAALRRIYRMLMGSGFDLPHNPFDSDRVPTPKAKSGQKRPTEMIDYKLVQKIMNIPDLNIPKGRRDAAILAVLFGGGLRRSEVVQLRIGDVRKSSNGTVYLRLRSTKSGKDADQALPDWAVEAVQEVMKDRVDQKAEPGDYLFNSYRGRGGITPTEFPLSDNGLYRLFKRYCEEGGAGKFLSPHSARATAITRLLDEGIPHREVQQFSRHSSVQMVELYDKRRYSIEESPGRLLQYEKTKK